MYPFVSVGSSSKIACIASRFSGLTTIRAHVPYIAPPSSAAPEPTLQGPNAEPLGTGRGTGRPGHGRAPLRWPPMEERWFDVAGDGGVRLRARRIAGASN